MDDKIKTKKEQNIEEERILQKKIDDENETIKNIKKTLKGRQSRAVKIKDLFAKHKAWMGTRQKLVDFREPVMILMRNNMNDEFYEDASKGTFKYMHSSGEERYLILDPRYLRSLPYAGRTVRYYLSHEDYPLPLPEDPALSAEKFNMAIERISSIEKEYKAKELKWRGEMWWKILTGIAVFVAVVGFVALAGGFEWISNFFNRGGGGGDGGDTGRIATTVGVLLLGKIKNGFKKK